MLIDSAGQYTGSYRLPVFIFRMIFILKIQQYLLHYLIIIACCLNNVRNATLFEGGVFSLLHCGEGTAVCVTKRESSETEAVELLQHELSHKYPPPPAISSRISHTSGTSALYLATFRPF